MIPMRKIAPISRIERAQLVRDAANLQAAAKRKGLTLDLYGREGTMAKKHFELGCWLWRFTKIRDLPSEQYLAERVEIVTRLFLAGFRNPRYDFFTVFDFGERQFDGIFEQGDSQDVIDGLRRNIPMDTTGEIKSVFESFGWPTAVSDTQVTPKAPEGQREMNYESGQVPVTKLFIHLVQLLQGARDHYVSETLVARELDMPVPKDYMERCRDLFSKDFAEAFKATGLSLNELTFMKLMHLELDADVLRTKASDLPILYAFDPWLHQSITRLEPELQRERQKA